MQRLDWSSLSPGARAKALARPARRRDPEVAAVVQRIFDDIETRGWEGVRRWSRDLDGCEPRRLDLGGAVVDAARARLEREDIEAIEFAIDQVRFFHEATAPKACAVETVAGVRSTRVWRPIATCALYVPAGAAPLVSTLIMLAEPARVAGVANRVLVSPPGRDGEPHPAIVAAAAACGLDALWLVGGAQAIAAATFGAGLPRADKIFGPGNVYVAEAKRRAASLPGGPAVDLPAGPSELMVIADAGANAAFVAADLLSQAEHDADAQVLLASPSAEFIDRVHAALARQLETLPRREIARASLAQACAILVRNIEEAVDAANTYAPEHLSLAVAEPARILERVENAGAVFVGRYAAESFGDYASGPSHVLPTDAAARAWSGVTTAAFMKSFTVQEIDAEGVRRLAPAVARLARLEGLEGHARAAELRAGEARPSATREPAIRRRRAEVVRNTSETRIVVALDLDRQTPPAVATGVGFYDHMLAQVAAHAGFALSLRCDGDLDVDAHHTIEDCALALGEALRRALGERRGIGRFGFVLPMDEAEAHVSVDLGGRPYLVFEASFDAPLLGAYPTQMTEHVFRSLAQSLGAAIHISVRGDNDHHKTEACFKAFGRALRQAIAREGQGIPSTKGVLA